MPVKPLNIVSLAIGLSTRGQGGGQDEEGDRVSRQHGREGTADAGLSRR